MIAHLKVNRQRQEFPWQLHWMQALPRIQGCPFAESLRLPSAAGTEKVRGMKQRATQEQTALGIAFQKSRWFAVSLWCG